MRSEFGCSWRAEQPGGWPRRSTAPLAGVSFAMELILRHWAAESFGMVVISSVTASVIGRSLLGNTPFLDLPAFGVNHLVEYPLFALLGLSAGLVGVAFSRIHYLIEDACDWTWRGPNGCAQALAGATRRGLLLLPQMYGVGYPVIGNAVAGTYGLVFLAALLIGNMVACSLTIGIGGSGGVFAPSLFCGAMFGALFGEVRSAGRAVRGRCGRCLRLGRDGCGVRRRSPRPNNGAGDHVRVDR
jgi:chloride channel protein, CIC family